MCLKEVYQPKLDFTSASQVGYKWFQTIDNDQVFDGKFVKPKYIAHTVDVGEFERLPDGVYAGLYRGINGTHGVRGETYKVNSNDLYKSNNTMVGKANAQYTSGFHLFSTQNDAITYLNLYHQEPGNEYLKNLSHVELAIFRIMKEFPVLFKVEWKHLLAIGMDKVETIVAKEMRLVERVGMYKDLV